MKVLIVCSKNSGKISPFITDQAKALVQSGVDIDFYCIEGKGFCGYLKNRRSLIKKIKSFKPNLVHAHYGLSGLLANTQRSVAVITTYHGSDINNSRWLIFSKISMKLSKYNIFVSKRTKEIANFKGENQTIIPCGVDLDLFIQMNKQKARRNLHLDLNKKYILFAGAFENKVKNAQLATKAVENLSNTELLELKGYSRENVALLMNAVDVCLLTSFSEGSPQFVKEAMACGTPLVSVDVGDVSDLVESLEGCYISTYKDDELRTYITDALLFENKTNGRNRLLDLGLDSVTTSEKIVVIYKQALKK